MTRDFTSKHGPEIEPRIQLVPFGKIVLTSAPRYIVQNLIPVGGLVIVWGPPKCGKSFWAFDLCLHVALNWTYRDLRVRGGPCVYCAFEGQSGIAARAEAFRQAHLTEEPDPIPFFLITERLDLVDDHGELIDAISAQIGDVKPAIVALDTLNRSLRGSENSDEDMAAYINAADAIKMHFGCAVLIIHHCGHDESRPRGHSALPAALDVQIKVRRDVVDNIIAAVEYAKDGPSGHAIASRLEVREVGTDDDGQPITSCVVLPAETAGTMTSVRAKKMPKTSRIALAALELAISEAGEPAPASDHIPQHVTVTTEEMWRRYAYRRGISTGEDRARQKAFKAAYETLIADGRVRVWGEYIWLEQ